jgi:hypothetical protein
VMLKKGRAYSLGLFVYSFQAFAKALKLRS